MGSFQICEIIEAKDEKITSFGSHRVRGQGREQKPPIRRTRLGTILDDDINKLFDSLSLRTSKSVDLPDRSRSASKKPMRAAGSYSPGIGFSDQVSLKQALRGLCVSQAVEMAAIKRSSIPASPRTSETGKISSLNRSVVVDAAEYSQSPLGGRERKKEISLAPGDDLPVPPDSVCFADQQVESCSSSVAHKGITSKPKSNTLLIELPKVCDVPSKFDVETPGSNNVAGVLSGDLPIPTEAVEKASKQRRKSRTVVASAVKTKGKKDLNSTSGSRRVFRTKSIVIKKAAKIAIPAERHSKTSHELKKVEDHSSGHIVCERCHCSLRDTDDKESSKDSSNTISVIKADKASKKNGKGDMSLSSKSSDDLSSSTTSLSDDSNLSSFHCSNKPHMSRDIRWKAINHVIEKCGSLSLKHFSLLKKLGSGDIGTVYLAELVGTNCQFAIKVMDNELLLRRKKMPRAQTEREILKMLDHPFLPTLYAQFTSDNLSCLVLEFCPGGDLHVLRQRQPGRYFPEEAARFYVAEVLLALEYLHMLGIVYRDLKPENILVRDDGHIMLTDFDLSLRCSVNPTLIQSSSTQFEQPRFSGQCTGSSCIDPFCTGPSCKVSCFTPHSSKARKQRGDPSLLAESLPQLVAEPTEARSNSFVGTHEYLAPEIIKGDGHGSAVDWWTLGIFLYELLYGRTPFKGAGNEETLTNVVLQNLRFPDTHVVSFHARGLIRSLLVREPENRLGTGTGAGEIKRHPFFHGLNWALVRSATPPQVPEIVELGNKGKGFLEYGDNGEKLEFELF